MDLQSGGRENMAGTYAVTGDKAALKMGSHEYTLTLKGDTQALLESRGETIILIKK